MPRAYSQRPEPPVLRVAATLTKTNYVRKEAGIMPEQNVHHREEADSKTDSDQQFYDDRRIKGEKDNEDNRHNRSGRVQCRN